MITIKRLKELIKDLPDDAKCWVYEGEVKGINIFLRDEAWWISAGEANEEETYTEGFFKEKK